MIPLYGFLRGDTLGLLVLADEHDTIATVARKLQDAASIRVIPRTEVRAFHEGRELDLASTVGASRLRALDRLDVEAFDVDSSRRNGASGGEAEAHGRDVSPAVSGVELVADRERGKTR